MEARLEDLIMKEGDYVLWEYTHHYNRRSSAQRTKRGRYIGEVKQRRQDRPRLCKVMFEGNARPSLIPLAGIWLDSKETP